METRFGVKTTDLRLRDVVRFNGQESPFGTMVVTRIEGETVHLFRPYATTADFETTAGVIPYIGIEQFAVLMGSDTTFDILDRPQAPR